MKKSKQKKILQKFCKILQVFFILKFHFLSRRPNPAEENEYYENDGHNNPPLSRQHLSAASPYHEYAPQSGTYKIIWTNYGLNFPWKLIWQKSLLKITPKKIHPRQSNSYMHIPHPSISTNYTIINNLLQNRNQFYNQFCQNSYTQSIMPLHTCIHIFSRKIGCKSCFGCLITIKIMSCHRQTSLVCIIPVSYYYYAYYSSLKKCNSRQIHTHARLIKRISICM